MNCCRAHGLKRGENGLKLIMMCEVPSNAILAEQFLEYFDGFSIGSNDMTQLTLALDRDSALVSALFDERDDAVKFLLSRGYQGLPGGGQIYRYLRPGTVGLSRFRPLAGGAGYCQYFTQPGHGGGYLGVPVEGG